MKELFDAIHEGCIDNVISSIRRSGIHINYIDETYGSPLHYAIECGVEQIIMIILEHGADINLHADDLDSPIHTAVKLGNLRVVKLLIDNGADIDSTHDCRNFTALQYAIIGENLSIAEALLEADADTDTDSIYTTTYPLMDAIRTENIDMVKLLLRYNVKINIIESNGTDPLGLSIIHGNIEIVKLLLQHITAYNYADQRYSLPIHRAVSHNNVEIVKLLLEHGFDVNSKDHANNTAMHFAVLEGYRDIVKLLLDYWPDVSIMNNDYVTCLKYCCGRTNKKEIMKMVVARIVLYRYGNISENIIGMQYNWYLIESINEFNDYRIQCEKELHKMGHTCVGKTSLLDACLGKIKYNILLRYANNNKTDITTFRIYNDLISDAIKIARYRNELVTKSVKIMDIILSSTHSATSSWKELPTEIKHIILEFLENSDLTIIIGSI